METWVLVADSGRARIFAVDNTQKQQQGSLYAPSENGALRGVLTEVIDRENPFARIPERNLASDEPGVQKESAEQHVHAVGRNEEPKKTEAERFAREVAAELEQGLKAGRFSRMYVIAPDHFLGYLRDVFSDHVKKTVQAEQDKDLTRMSPQEIRSHLPAKL